MGAAVPESLPVSTLLPSWPLLWWSGLAATLTSVWILGTLMPQAGGHALAPRARRAALPAWLLGVFVYPLGYALPFQLMHDASLILGATFGIGHAVLLILAGGRERPGMPVIMQRVATVIAYGAVLGFSYVTP